MVDIIGYNQYDYNHLYDIIIQNKSWLIYVDIIATNMMIIIMMISQILLHIMHIMISNKKIWFTNT